MVWLNVLVYLSKYLIDIDEISYMVLYLCNESVIKVVLIHFNQF
jgi:hypothetical protein